MLLYRLQTPREFMFAPEGGVVLEPGVLANLKQKMGNKAGAAGRTRQSKVRDSSDKIHVLRIWLFSD